MTQIENALSVKVGKLSLIDGGLIGISKLTSEQLLSKTFIGNGTFKSGGYKLVGAIGMSMIANKYTSIVSTGLLIDAMEDMFLAGKRYVEAKMGNEQASAEMSAFN